MRFDAPPSSLKDQQPSDEIVDVPDHRPRRSPKIHPKPPIIEVLAYLNWVIMGIFAFFRSVLLRFRFETNNQAQELLKQRHFPPLYNHWDALFTQYIYRRMRDILNRPIAGRPGAVMPLKDRISYDRNWTYVYPGTTTDVINLGSYNYLGFSENSLCNEEAIKAIAEYGVGVCGPFHENGYSWLFLLRMVNNFKSMWDIVNHLLTTQSQIKSIYVSFFVGTNEMHQKLEKLMAEFLGVEDCFCCPMGFGTNTMNIPALVNKDALILSDELNHASLILGCRFSGAVTKVSFYIQKYCRTVTPLFKTVCLILSMLE